MPFMNFKIVSAKTSILNKKKHQPHIDVKEAKKEQGNNIKDSGEA